MRLKLKLLDGLKWRGHLTVIAKLDDGRYLVDFDANANYPTAEGWIGDRASLTAKQLKDWTGYEMKS